MWERGEGRAESRGQPGLGCVLGSEHEMLPDPHDQSSVSYGFRLGSENQPRFSE